MSAPLPLFLDASPYRAKHQEEAAGGRSHDHTNLFCAKPPGWDSKALHNEAFSLCKPQLCPIKRRDDSEFVRLMDQAGEIMTNNLRQRLIHRSNVRLGTERVAEFPLHHREARLKCSAGSGDEFARFYGQR